MKDGLVKMEYQTGQDGMMYPDIRISENPECDQRVTGRFGRQWKKYMQENHPIRLAELIAQGKINEILAQVDREADRKKEKLIQQMLEKEPMPEREDALDRAAHMEMLIHQAEEIILFRIVYRLR